jgi:hypothetical protein
MTSAGGVRRRATTRVVGVLTRARQEHTPSAGSAPWGGGRHARAPRQRQADKKTVHGATMPSWPLAAFTCVWAHISDHTGIMTSHTLAMAACSRTCHHRKTPHTHTGTPPAWHTRARASRHKLARCGGAHAAHMWLLLQPLLSLGAALRAGREGLLTGHTHGSMRQPHPRPRHGTPPALNTLHHNTRRGVKHASQQQPSAHHCHVHSGTTHVSQAAARAAAGRMRVRKTSTAPAWVGVHPGAPCAASALCVHPCMHSLLTLTLGTPPPWDTRSNPRRAHHQTPQYIMPHV